MGLAAGLALMVVGACFIGLIRVKKTYKQAA
jgi:hypothetical protein